MTESVDEFDVLETLSNVVMYSGTRLEIKPLTVGQLPKFVRGIRPVLERLVLLDDILDKSNGEATDATFLNQVMELIENSGEELQSAMAIAVDKPIEFIAAGDLLEFIALVQAVIRINRDFFGQRLGPLIAQIKK